MSIALEEFKVRCAICGFALKEIEVAGEILGRYIDYNKRKTGEASLVICGECWQNMMDRQSETMSHSIQRRRRSFGGDV